MLRFKSSALLFVLTALSLAQTASQLVTPEIRRVGDKLGCLCGSCNNTVATCQMLECHYSLPARQEISKKQSLGMNDQEIIDGFVKKSGLVALASPPIQGFSLLAWTMPFAMVAVGLGSILLFVKRIRKPIASSAPEIDPVLMDKYHEQIEKDLAKLD